VVPLGHESLEDRMKRHSVVLRYRRLLSVIEQIVFASRYQYKRECWVGINAITNIGMRLIIVDIAIDIVSDALCQ
jgi:hypothetical protein